MGAIVGSDADPAAVKAYATFHCACRAADYLSDDFVEEDFAFFGKELNGQKELKPRWKRVINHANGLIGELVGEKYVAKNFPEEAKGAALSLAGTSLFARSHSFTFVLPTRFHLILRSTTWSSSRHEWFIASYIG